MSTYFSGSDGNIYVEPYNNQFTGSLYKTTYIKISEDDDDENDLSSVPGILYDTDNEIYQDYKWSGASFMSGTGSFDESNMEGCVWVYNLNDSQKNTIESDAQYIATYVTSSL
jgi:hypothetical protein